MFKVWCPWFIQLFSRKCDLPDSSKFIFATPKGPAQTSVLSKKGALLEGFMFVSERANMRRNSMELQLGILSKGLGSMVCIRSLLQSLVSLGEGTSPYSSLEAEPQNPNVES